MHFRIRLLRACLGLLILLAARTSYAQATRTWVSGVGDDANPCSRTAPCKTFAGAISKTAAGGEIDVLDPGGFGAVTITKSISIEADGVIAGVLVTGTNGIVISAGVSDVVVIRGLTIEGLGSGLAGVRFLAGKALFIEDCTINNFVSNGIDFEPSGQSTLNVKNTAIRNSTHSSPAAGGILIKPAGGTAIVALEGVRSEGNLFGFRAEAGAKVSAKDCVAANNANSGFVAYGLAGAAELNLESCSASGNGQSGSGSGVYSTGVSAIVRISNTTVSGNPNGLTADSGAKLLSFRNNSVGGNVVDGAPTGTLTPQ